MQLTPAYVFWLADVHGGRFAPAFTLSLRDCEIVRKPPKRIASLVMHNSKKKKKMVKRIILKAKLHYYTKFINRLVNYLVLLLRNDIVKQNNYEEKTDSYLRKIALKKLLPEISNHMTEGEIDNEYLTELTCKISSNTHEKIEQIKKEYSLYFEALDNLPDKYFEDDVKIIDFYDEIDTSHRFDNIKIRHLRPLTRKYQKEIDKLSKPISERNAKKFEIRFEHFTKMLTFCAPILLIGGIFKQYLVSVDFSFSLPTVFTLNDYISTSIDTLIFAIFPTVVFIVGSYISLHEDSRIDLIQRKRVKKVDYLLYLNAILTISLTIFLYFDDRKFFYSLLPISVMFLLVFILPKILYRYLKPDFNLYILIISTFWFYLSIFSDAKSDTYKIKSNNTEKKIEFELTENIKDLKSLIYVTSGTNYYVFWNTKDSTTILIKKELVKRIIIK